MEGFDNIQQCVFVDLWLWHVNKCEANKQQFATTVDLFLAYCQVGRLLCYLPKPRELLVH